ncbi:DNA repair/RNA processing cpsf family [Anaeramoeba flamelloides]|uniref:DNA repair/RNA processing cpsf family n=1 Tax=Anaeramoeba flamelloides TaxID=1746091 RepID=A0ABQ8X713_9EUKA|nr:DNA repair/RNA processing cpsf family [Anaeramoeba flamelloides]
MENNYYYLSTIHESHSIQTSDLGYFISNKYATLVLCGPTKFILYNIKKTGVEGFLEVPIYGKLLTAQYFNVECFSKSLLLIVTDDLKVRVLKYDPKTKELITFARGDLSDRNYQPVDFCKKRVLVDEDRGIILFYFSQGFFKILPFDNVNGQFSKSFNVKFEELNVYDLCLFNTRTKNISEKKQQINNSNLSVQKTKLLNEKKNNLIICILCETTNGSKNICSYSLDLINQKLIKELFEKPCIEKSTNKIFPLQQSNALCLLNHLGVSFLYFKSNILKQTKTTIFQNGPTLITSYCKLKQDLFLLADYLGYYHLMEIKKKKSKKSFQIEIDSLFDPKINTIPTCLTYIDIGLIFVGSTLGSSIFIHLDIQTKLQSKHKNPKLIKKKEFENNNNNNNNNNNTKNRITNENEMEIEIEIEIENENKKVMQKEIKINKIFSLPSNTAPISDLVYVPINQKSNFNNYPYIISCSNTYNHGTLSILSRRIGINFQAELELPFKIEKIISLSSLKGTFIILTLSGDFQILQFSKKESSNIIDCIEHDFSLTNRNNNNKIIEIGSIIFQKTPLLLLVDTKSISILQYGLKNSNIDNNNKFIYRKCNIKWEIGSTNINEKINHAIWCESLKLMIVSTSDYNLSLIKLESGPELDNLSNIENKEMHSNSFHLKLINQAKFNFEISCLKILNFYWKNNTIIPVIIISFWGEYNLKIYSLPKLKLLIECRIEEKTIVRSISILDTSDLNNKKQSLLIGLGDGTLLIYMVDLNKLRLIKENKLIIGSQSLKLIPLNNYPQKIDNGNENGNDNENDNDNEKDNDNDYDLEDLNKMSDNSQRVNEKKILIVSEKVTLIQYKNNRWAVYPLQLDRINDISPLITNSKEYLPNSLLIIKENKILISNITKLTKTHIRQIKLNGMATKIKYLEKSQSIVILTTKFFNDSIKGLKVKKSKIFLQKECFIKLLNYKTFLIQSQYQLRNNEEGKCITSWELNNKIFIAIGTQIILNQNKNHISNKKGRILIFLIDRKKSNSNDENDVDINSKHQLIKIGEIDLGSVVYSLDWMVDAQVLLAGIGRELCIFKLKNDNNDGNDDDDDDYEIGGGYSITLINQIKTQVMSFGVESWVNQIFHADVLKSITLYKYHKEKNQIVCKAREFRGRWITAFKVINKNLLVVADRDKYLVILKRIPSLESKDPEKRARMQCHAKIYLGQFVNSIKLGTMSFVTKENNDNLKNSLIIGTASGHVFSLMRISRKNYNIFWKLQKVMSKNIIRFDCKNIPFRKSNKIIDGDFIEDFLEIDQTNRDKIFNDIQFQNNYTLENLKKLVFEMTLDH